MTAGSQPTDDEIFLDHIGHWLPDAAAAEHCLTTMGFSVTPFSEQQQQSKYGRALEPAGAGNYCVMLQRGYLEFLTPLPDAHPDGPTPITLELSDGIKRYVGVHIAAFSTPDCDAMQSHLAGCGVKQRPLARLSRDIKTADGGVHTARFSVARPERGQIAEGRVQFLTHHTPELLWQERWVHHANTSEALTGLVFSVTDLDEAVVRYQQIFARAGQPLTSGHIFELESGSLALLSEPRAEALFGNDSVPRAPGMIAYMLKCGSVSTFKQFCDAANVASSMPAEHIVIANLPGALGSIVIATSANIALASVLES